MIHPSGGGLDYSSSDVRQALQAHRNENGHKEQHETTTPLPQRNGIKNETCRYFMNGSCKFGSRCRFSHNAIPVGGDQSITRRVPNALRPDDFQVKPGGASAPDASSRTEDPKTIARQPPAKRKPCFKWVASGTCKKGDACQYIHDPAIPDQLKRERERRIAEEAQLRVVEERRRQEEARRAEEQRIEAERRIEAQRIEEERRREEAERARQAELRRRREEEQARRQAEIQRRRDEQHRIDAARTVTTLVDGCVVTFSAGLAVESIVASFDVTRGRIMDLPQGVQANDIAALFERHGFERTGFAVEKAFRSNCAFVSIDTTLVARVDSLPPLHGSTLRFTAFKNALADEGAGGSAFGRTVSFQILVPKGPDQDFTLDALDTHLRQLSGVPRPRSIRRDTTKGGRDARATIFAEFDTWEDARQLRDKLRADWAFRRGYMSYNYNRIFLPSKYSYPIFLTTAQHDVQRAQWDELAGACRQAQCELRVRNMPDGKVRVNLHGDVLEQVGPLKVRAEQLGQGTTINMWNRRLFDNVTAKKLTDDLRDTTGALVEVDRRLKALRAYGPAGAVERAREQLTFFAEELARKEYSKDLANPRTVRFFCEVGYPQLRETYGEDAVTLDLVSTPKKITVTGDEEIRHRLDRLLGESFGDWGAAHASADDEHTCPICTCPASAPSALGCGHVYCTECLTHFVRSALEGGAFPLRCSGADGTCAAPLALAVLERFLPPAQQHQLREAAFHAHVAAHPAALKPCRTPGCTQRYAPLAARAALACPGCFVRLCGMCGRAPHAGVGCAEAARDPSEAYIASAASGIRPCPRCAAPVYKDGGCQHVACRCGAHVCWRCMAAFDGSDACYAHMRTAHGGIFEQDMDAAVARGHVEPAAPQIPREFVEEDRLARAQAAQNPGGVRAAFARRQQEIRDRRQAEFAAWAMDLDRLWGQNNDAEREAERRRERVAAELERQRVAAAYERRLAAAEQERRRAAAERARQEQGGGWCVVM